MAAATDLKLNESASWMTVLGGAKDGQDSERIKHFNKLIRTHGGKVDAVRYLIDLDRDRFVQSKN